MSMLRKQYNLNPETLLYEIAKEPVGRRIRRIAFLLCLSLGVTALFFWLYIGVLDLDPPKTAYLKRQNAKWNAKLELMNRQLDIYEAELQDLNLRNDDIYRSIFGMNQIPEEVLNAGFGGVNRYSELEGFAEGSILRDTYMRLDMLIKRSYVQSKSFDEVANMSKRAGEMASCIPAIPPIDPKKGTFRLSSSFGTRRDPVYGGYRHHDGNDFSTKTGNPIYATGDGVVEKVEFQFFGYGRQVLIDHGFGYKTRYAHMNTITVVEGMSIKRGDCIGTVGNTGKSTGSHLHYEVIYRGKAVNPSNFYDLDITSDEYASMVRKNESESEAMLRPQFTVEVNKRNRK